MRRHLGTFETAATLTNDVAPFVVVVVLELDGGPSLERLRAALAILQRRHPLLRVRIVESAGRFWYEPLADRSSRPDGRDGGADGPQGPPPIPLRPVTRAGDEHWQRVAEEELNRRIDSAAGPLMRCVYVTPSASAGAPVTGSGASARCEILLAFHHAIMDATSGTALVRELLSLCDPAVRPDLAMELPRERSVLPPVETLFPAAARGLGGKLRAGAFLARQVADELSYRWRTWGGRKPPIASTSRCHILPVALSCDETAALVQASRRRRVTLNGALGAAFLRAVDDHLFGGRARALRYMTFADLRSYLDPPVAAEELGSFLAMMRYTAPMTRREGTRGEGSRPARSGAIDGADGDFWLLARHLSDQVARGARRGDKLWSVRFSEAVMRMLLRRRTERMAATAISYTGVARLDPESSVRRLHAFVSNFALGPEYTAHARIFEGMLLLDILYLDVDMDGALARTLADEILATLRRAGAEGNPAWT